MSEAFSTDEVDDLRTALENANAKIFELREQKDRQVAELEFKLIRVKDELELDLQQKVVEVEIQNAEKIQLLSSELEKLRNAYQGDASGWIERVTPGGLVIYENSELGQTTYDEPEVLYIAKIMRRADEVEETLEDNKKLRAKLKDLEVKKREADLSVNKLKTEVNNLRKSDKSWKDAAKTIAGNLMIVKNMFDVQCDQVIHGLDIASKVSQRIQSQIPSFRHLKTYIVDMKDKCDQQQNSIMNLNTNVRSLQSDVKEKDRRIDQLSIGIGDELERLTRPLRDRLADTMVAAMKEKANRAQERQELADLWPDNHLMPTILMKYRTLSSEEKSRRLDDVKRSNAKLALSIEIRRNVAESKLWDLKYDDYGRPFYEHMKTGEVQWEEPEIRRYVPPQGYDTSGNIVESYHDVMEKWRTLSTSKGEVYFQHIDTGEISYIPPYAYHREPVGKPYEVLVGEAAQLVLGYIKNKISFHIDNMKNLKLEDHNLMTPDERRLKEKEDRIKARLGLSPDASSRPAINNTMSSPSNASIGSIGSFNDPKDDLTLYQYDIETVEMLAWQLDDQLKRLKKPQRDAYKHKKRDFLHDAKIRDYNTETYIGPTLYETDTTLLSIQQVRAIVEYFVMMEEKLDVKISKTRENLKDFSFILMEKVKIAEGVPEDVIIPDDADNVQHPSSMIAVTSIGDDMKPHILESNIPYDEIPDHHDDGEDAIPLQHIDHQLEECYVKTMGDLLYDYDMNIISSSDMITSALITTCSQLINFSLYCGYTNTNIDNLPDNIFSYKASSSMKTSSSSSQHDDEWLTSSYFLSVTKHNVEMIRKLISYEYDPADGIRPTNPLNSAIFIKGHVREPSSSSGYDNNDDDRPETDMDEHLSDTMYRQLNDEKMEEIFGQRGAHAVKHIPRVKVSKSWTARTRAHHDSFSINHEVWKSRQFMADILRHQLQQQALQAAIDTRLHASSLSSSSSASSSASSSSSCGRLSSTSVHPILSQDRDRVVVLSIHHIVLECVSWSQWMDDGYYVQCSIGLWKYRSSAHTLSPGASSIVWGHHHQLNKSHDNQRDDDHHQDNDAGDDDLTSCLMVMHVPLSRLDAEYMTVEVYRSRDYAADHLIGSCHVILSPVIQHYASIQSISSSITDHHHISSSDQYHDVGNIMIRMKVDDVPRAKPVDVDPHHHIITHVLIPPDHIRHAHDLSSSSSSSGDHKMMKTDKLAGVYPILPNEKLSFASLFNDYNSTDGHLVKLIAGDITADDVLQAGYRLTDDIPTSSASSSSSSVIHPLPDFSRAKSYLRRKAKLQHHQVSHHEDEIKQLYPLLDNLAQEKLSIATKRYHDCKKRLSSYDENRIKIEEEIKRIYDRMKISSTGNSPPKEPIIDEILPASYVPMIPNIAQSRDDKTRVILGSQQITSIITSIQDGLMDGKDWFELFGQYRANPKQIRLLSSEIQQRNEYLDVRRNQHIHDQQQAIDAYNDELSYYEKEEKRRKLEYNKLKKDVRKMYLKYDVCMECIQQVDDEYRSYEVDVKSLEEMMMIHEEARNRYHVIRMKQYLEKERQKKILLSLKKRLLQVVNHRRQLLNLPLAQSSSSSSSSSSVRYDDLCHKVESALRSLSYELLDIKQQLISEGVKLRQIHHEELSSCAYEHHRLSLLHDIIHQRSCVDIILERSRYEMMHLYDSKEKILMIEAEKDDAGYDTIDHAGERYAYDKDWTSSSEMISCLRLINLMKHKIELINNINKSSSSYHHNIIQTISLKWKDDYHHVRDSWCENSDYERAQTLLHDMMIYVSSQHHRLKHMEEEISYERLELQQQISSYHHHIQQQDMMHHQEIESISSSAAAMISSYQQQLHDLSSSSHEKQSLLEETIMKINHECHDIQQHMTSQAMIYDDKNKILWAMISTQQDAVQHLTAKLENIIDEREKIIIDAKLNYDRLRSQLRHERKYSSSLLFIIQSQRGNIQYLHRHITSIISQAHDREMVLHDDKMRLRHDIYDHIYAITRLSTDPDELFEFFVSRLANICGSKKRMNDVLGQHNNAVMVLAALCKSPRAIIRQYAARALGHIGWNGYVEDRVLVWDAMMHWKIFMKKVISPHHTDHHHTDEDHKDDDHKVISYDADKRSLYEISKARYAESGNMDAILDAQPNITAEEYARHHHHQDDDTHNDDHDDDKVMISRDEEFAIATGLSSSNASVRTIIKQRRQYALRAVRRIEGPNIINLGLINMHDGIIPSLLSLCHHQPSSSSSSSMTSPASSSVSSYLTYDDDIARYAILAICVSSYDDKNHHDMSHDRLCVDMLVRLCRHDDAEIQTHAAVTIANLCHNDEEAQYIFGQTTDIIEVLLSICNHHHTGDHHINDDDDVVDVIEAATAALANITCYSDINCKKVLDLHGVHIIIQVIISSYSDNLLDMDQQDEIHANAAEMLANISRYHADDSIIFFDHNVMDSLVMMCASKNLQVKRHAPLVIGNIAQSERCREMMGARGVIEALFLALEDVPTELPIHHHHKKKKLDDAHNDAHDDDRGWVADPTVQANVLWALCNLMWHPPNQERAGRFMHDILQLIQPSSSSASSSSSHHHPVQIYAHMLLANTLYYNNANRVRFLEYDDGSALDMLMSHIQHPSFDTIILEHSLRAMLSLSYLDYVSQWIVQHHHLPLLLGYLKPSYISNDVLRFSLGIISNLSVSYDHRKLLFALGGLDILIDLSLHDDKNIIDISQDIIQRLEDVMAADDVSQRKASIGLSHMIELAKSDDILVRATAAESIGEEIWHDPSKQHLAIEQGGMDALIKILQHDDERYDSILPSLWSLRNLLHQNSEAQHQFFMKDGISSIIPLFKRCFRHEFEDQGEKVLEACLACIATAIINHTGNSRRLLVVGLQVIVDIVEGHVLSKIIIDHNNEYMEITRKAFMNETVIALAKTILLMLGPYNYIICKNCSKKQELSGTNCVACGHRLRVDVAGIAGDSDKVINKSTENSRIDTSSPHKKDHMGSSMKISVDDKKTTRSKNKMKGDRGGGDRGALPPKARTMPTIL